MSDYDRIACAIRYLEAQRRAQPDLAALAAHVGLSPYHLHRLFRAWAGITPKDFLQCLTLEHAKGLLHAGASVLDAALDAGLSGPGRLHDACVALEAASPGEVKSGGAGWTLHAGVADTPFGPCLIAEGPRGVCHLGFLDAARSASVADELTQLQAAWPAARLRRDDAGAARVARRIFVRTPQGAPPLRALVRGTDFQVRVWRALLRVPPGAAVSYGRLAAALGRPGAGRAVGAAVGRNPLAYLIPCHRVIRETGVIGDYRWDATRKRAMLAWEAAASDGAAPGSDML
ncbi:methylated-DNA--[protein]-cysteine S-methyltransferase [Ectothiorhodospiraceae bacterium 2226]|nr:methylated-DNA--[protein]-cysteine S-methyltransferase [Ectothiorhodospiraceae bacterium 2226]